MDSTLDFHCNLSPDVIADAFLKLDQQSDKPDVTQMKLNKLMYFAQAQYLASTGQRLFDDRIEAFKHGPIVPSMRRRFRGYDKNILSEICSFDEPDLPPDVEEFIKGIWRLYGSKSAAALRNLSHKKGGAWSKWYKPAGQHIVIPDADMASDIRALPASQRVFNDCVAVIDSSMFEDYDMDAAADRAADAFRELVD